MLLAGSEVLKMILVLSTVLSYFTVTALTVQLRDYSNGTMLCQGWTVPHVANNGKITCRCGATLQNVIQ